MSLAKLSTPFPIFDKTKIIPSATGVKVLSIGPVGSGKTHALITALTAGLEVFGIFTENGEKTLLRLVQDLPPEVQKNFHYALCKPATVGFDVLQSAAKKINTLTFEGLAKLTDVDKTKFDQFFQMLSLCNDFIDQHGVSYGSIGDFSYDKLFFLDSMTGLNQIAMDLVIGGKPTKNQAEWGVAQDNLFRFVLKLCNDLTCHFYLTGHISRETDETLGKSYITINTLGKALAPKIPQNFDEVVYNKRDGDKFLWATSEPGADTKGRLLPLSAKLEPSFHLLLENWAKAYSIPGECAVVAE